MTLNEFIDANVTKAGFELNKRTITDWIFSKNVTVTEEMEKELNEALQKIPLEIFNLIGDAFYDLGERNY